MEHPDPIIYRTGLRLHEIGANDDFIADCLGIIPRAYRLIEIGGQKLAVEHRPAASLDLCGLGSGLHQTLRKIQ
jgi:hypothetical protein